MFVLSGKPELTGANRIAKGVVQSVVPSYGKQPSAAALGSRHRVRVVVLSGLFWPVANAVLRHYDDCR
jgi:hypothetical protein